MKPSIGRIVHYSTLNGEVFPALITRVHDTGVGVVALTVFRDDGTSMGISRSRPTVATPGSDAAFGCWTWPEVVDGIGVKLPVADTTGTLPNMVFAADSIDSLKAERDAAVKARIWADDLCHEACKAADAVQTENAKLKQRIADLERHSAALNDQCVQQQIALSGIRAVFQQHDAPGAK